MFGNTETRAPANITTTAIQGWRQFTVTLTVYFIRRWTFTRAYKIDATKSYRNRVTSFQSLL